MPHMEDKTEAETAMLTAGAIINSTSKEITRKGELLATIKEIGGEHEAANYIRTYTAQIVKAMEVAADVLLKEGGEVPEEFLNAAETSDMGDIFGLGN